MPKRGMGPTNVSSDVASGHSRLPAVAELREQAEVPTCIYKTGLVASYPQYIHSALPVFKIIRPHSGHWSAPGRERSWLGSGGSGALLRHSTHVCGDAPKPQSSQTRSPVRWPIRISICSDSCGQVFWSRRGIDAPIIQALYTAYLGGSRIAHRVRSGLSTGRGERRRRGAP